MIDITPLVSAFISLLAAIITIFLIPYLKAKVGERKFDEIMSWVQIAVAAAEMIYVGPGRGEEKKRYVLDYLEGKGFSLDIDSINNMIEAAVLELNK